MPRFVAPLLSWAALPVVVVGWTVAQTFPTAGDGYSVKYGVIIHIAITSTFSAILFVSGLINAIIVTVRARALRLMLSAPGAVLVLAVGWLTCLLAGPDAGRVEALFSLALVGGSTAALIAATFPRAELPGWRPDATEAATV